MRLQISAEQILAFMIVNEKTCFHNLTQEGKIIINLILLTLSEHLTDIKCYNQVKVVWLYFAQLAKKCASFPYGLGIKIFPMGGRLQKVVYR